MRKPVSDDYFSFMSEKGQGKSKTLPPRPAAVVTPPRPAAVVPPPAAFSPAHTPRVNPDSGMEVTETSISDAMIQEIFRRRPTDETSAALDD